MSAAAISSKVEYEYKHTTLSWDNTGVLTSRITGDGCFAEQCCEDDIEFYKDLFANRAVMQFYRAGEPRDKAETEALLRERWIPRFTEKSAPYGAYTVFQASPDDESLRTRVGYFIMGEGEDVGGAEAGYAFLPDYQGKGVGTQIVDRIVHELAPMVSSLAQDTECSYMRQLQCFNGAALKMIESTASPENIASWKISDRMGFVAAVTKVADTKIQLDLSQEPEFPNDQIISRIKALDIEHGIRYRMIDPSGVTRTFSWHPLFNRVKYHFERPVEQLAEGAVIKK